MSSTLSPLDGQQVLRDVHDVATHKLRVDAEVTAVIGELEVMIDHTEDSIAIGTATDLFTATTIGADVALDVNVVAGSVTGTLNPSGLSVDLRTTRMTVTDVATKIPGIADLTGRNTMSVRLIGSSVVYFGDSSVTAATGYPKFQQEEMVLDIQANASVDLWGICASGQSCEIAVLEIA